MITSEISARNTETDKKSNSRNRGSMSNFDFLQLHDELLLRLAQTTEACFVPDPNTTGKDRHIGFCNHETRQDRDAPFRRMDEFANLKGDIPGISDCDGLPRPPLFLPQARDFAAQACDFWAQGRTCRGSGVMCDPSSGEAERVFPGVRCAASG